MTSEQRRSKSYQDVAIQCSADDLKQPATHGYPVLIGHRVSSRKQTKQTTPVSCPPGFSERGIQVDLDEYSIDSLADLLAFYCELLPVETIKQFYELCMGDVQWTRTHINDYLQHSHHPSTIPTLRQLSFNALTLWNEQIKHANPSFDTISIGDLLQDINDENVFEELISEPNPADDSSPELTDANQMIVPWSVFDSLGDLYGDLPDKSMFAASSHGIVIPLDDEFSLNIYHALRRSVGLSSKKGKSVVTKKVTNENKKLDNQRWVPPARHEPSVKSSQPQSTPSFKQLMEEDLNYDSIQKATPVRTGRALLLTLYDSFLETTTGLCWRAETQGTRTSLSFVQPRYSLRYLPRERVRFRSHTRLHIVDAR